MDTADEFDIDTLHAAASEGRIQWHQHALERFIERGITRAEVVGAIIDGEVIDVYSADRPYPSCLILRIAAEPVHVVAAVDSEARICHVITAYRPDPGQFAPDFKTRKEE